MNKVANTNIKVEFGDFQTPIELTNEITKVLFDTGITPKSIIEPTCGEGNFLLSAISQFPNFEKAIGFDINPIYVDLAKDNLMRNSRTNKTKVERGDFFTIDWNTHLDSLPSPLLVIGNPPWVTNSKLGSLGSNNLPAKSNFQKHNGLLAMTGKSNFDISEWMLLKILDWLNGKDGTLAMLCKNSVARKVLSYAWKNKYNIYESRKYLIDAQLYFNATVDACLLICNFKPHTKSTICKIYPSLKDESPSTEIGYMDGLLIADINCYKRWSRLKGDGLQWRSGIKHDCSKVMELYKEGEYFINGLGEKVFLEDFFVYPMLKSSELVSGKKPTRWMIVTQKSIGEDTSTIKVKAPKTWKYLNDHLEFLTKRGSSIYKNKPQFSIFGVGDYSFSPWKVAISALYKKLDFKIVGSWENKPIVLDDTQNFLPCWSYEDAEYKLESLNSNRVKEFYKSFIFWDEKRPITINLLKYLDFKKLGETAPQYPYMAAA